MKQLTLSLLLTATLGLGCSGDATIGDVSLIPSDASTLTDLGPSDAALSRDSGSRPDIREDARPEEEPLSPVVEACTELFPPLCGKMIECVVGDSLGELFAPACDLLLEGGQDILVSGCEALTGILPGGDFLGDLIVDLLFPVVEECIEDFACTPENIGYFAGAFGDLFSAFSSGGEGGFDVSSIGNLIDLFTDCDIPPEPEPEPEPDTLDDVADEDASAPSDAGPEEDVTE